MTRTPNPSRKPIQANCPLHPSMITRRVCEKCGRPMCVRCDELSTIKGSCPSCATKSRQPGIWHDERFRVSLLAASVLLIVLTYIFPYQQDSQQSDSIKMVHGDDGLLLRRPVPEFYPVTLIVKRGDFGSRNETYDVPIEPIHWSTASEWTKTLEKTKRIPKRTQHDQSKANSGVIQKPADAPETISSQKTRKTKSEVLPRETRTNPSEVAHTKTSKAKSGPDARSVRATASRDKPLNRHFLGNDPLAKYHLDVIPSEDRCIVLTFDGNFMNNCVDPILQVLAEKGVSATFFLTGFFVTHFPEDTKKILAAGHEIGNHTWSHPRLTTYDQTKTHKTRPNVTRNNISSELQTTAEAFTALTGQDLHPFWRAPFGEHNRQIRTWAYAEGYLHIGWTSGMDSIDWLDNPASRFYWRPEKLKKRLLNKLGTSSRSNSKIILFHLGSVRPDKDRPVHMLASFIDEARSRGFEFKTIGQSLQSSQKIQTASKLPSDNSLMDPLSDSSEPIGK